MSVRQLQWWDESALIMPARDGHERSYGYEELFQIALLKSLRRRNLSIRRIRPIFQFLSRKLASNTIESMTNSYLITDGLEHRLESNLTILLSAIMQANRPVVCISLADVLHEAALALKKF